MKYKTNKQNTVFKNKYLELQNNDVENTYNQAHFQHIRLIENNSSTPGSAVVCTHNNKYLMIKSYRYGVERECWEIPRGYKIGNETPIACAIREINEEVNISKSSIISCSTIGEIDVNSSIIASSVAIVLIQLNQLPSDKLQKTELISESIWLSFIDVKKWIKEYKIVDSFSLSAFMLLSTLEDVH